MPSTQEGPGAPRQAWPELLLCLFLWLQPSSLGKVWGCVPAVARGPQTQDPPHTCIWKLA